MAALATAEEREATAALATASADLLQVMVQTAGGVGHLEAINLIVVCLPAFIVTRFLDRRITKSTCQANFPSWPGSGATGQRWRPGLDLVGLVLQLGLRHAAGAAATTVTFKATHTMSVPKHCLTGSVLDSRFAARAADTARATGETAAAVAADLTSSPSAAGAAEAGSTPVPEAVAVMAAQPCSGAAAGAAVETTRQDEAGLDSGIDLELDSAVADCLGSAGGWSVATLAVTVLAAAAKAGPSGRSIAAWSGD